WRRRGRGSRGVRVGRRRRRRVGGRAGVAGVVPGPAGRGAAGADRQRHQHGVAGPVQRQRGRLLPGRAGRPAGGGAGAALLLSPPARLFEQLVPLLIGGASLVLLLQPGISRLTGGRLDERSPALLAGVFAVGIYGGYLRGGGRGGVAAPLG